LPEDSDVAVPGTTIDGPTRAELSIVVPLIELLFNEELLIEELFVAA